MKIFNVVTQEEAGGAQHVAHQLTLELNRLGAVSSLLFLYTKRSVASFADVSETLMGHPVKNLLDFGRIIFRLWKRLRYEKPDVVICHTHYSNIVVAPIAWLAGINVRLAVHHSPLNNYPEVAGLLNKIMDSSYVISTNVMVSDAVSESANGYPKLFIKKMVTICNGVESLPEDTLNMTRPFDDGLFVLSHVGRFADVKNQIILLDVLDQVPGTALIAVGDGELKGKFEQRVHELGLESRVFLPGEIDKPQVWSYLKVSDAFIFPSRFEAMGLALVEAMSARLPVIVSDLPATREVLLCDEGAYAGLFVDGDNVEDIADALRQLMSEPEKMAQLGGRAEKRSMAYSNEKMGKDYLTLINRLISNG